jgi:hypothetical protein
MAGCRSAPRSCIVTPTPTPTSQPGEISVWIDGPVTGDGILTLVAAVLAAAVVIIGYSIQKEQARKAEQATVYGEAIRAVHDYLEAPYRVRRRDGGSAARMAITGHVSDVQSRLAYYETLLRVHAPTEVATAYKTLVATAKREAGPQMTAAWKARPTRNDREVPMGAKFDQPLSAAALENTIDLMGQRHAPKQQPSILPGTSS